MNNVTLSAAEIWDRALNNDPSRQKKMEAFYVSCEAPALSNLAEIWHSTADEGALQVQPAIHLHFWGLSSHIGDLSCVMTGVKGPSKNFSLFYPRQELIRWDILWQLWSKLNPCGWMVRKGAIKVLPEDGLAHTLRSDDITPVELLSGRRCHK